MSCQYIGGAYVRACDVTIPSRTPILSLVEIQKNIENAPSACLRVS